ncbi:DUF1206 domain-containing protein [Chelatococcus sambhunathii]|uniref:DUF1206 domain-containing protein n=1 Tax=Chelatococcus sambhunathii TaxID=363953 RepID=A0ABU1DG86_9HYPH|nr:DUF1206 domain-containing protein [Chelatococcus sambhunathii]MDR4307136.1 DUF1206 domain-containing protein [Chelatococcus sambhunathii]
MDLFAPAASRSRIELFARAGFAARGAVYVLVGTLALLAAIGSGFGDVGGGKSALQALLGQPFGALLLAAVGLGLVFFSVWRLVSALTDADSHGTSPKGLGVRAVHALSGVVNGALAVSALHLALGFGMSGGDDDAAQDWTAWLLSQPFGQWLVGAVGLGVVGGGVFHLWKGFRGDVLKRLAVPAARRKMALALGRAGYAARGVVFGVIGVFLVTAAIRADSSEAKGLGGALQALEEQPYGWALLGLVAAGLAAFGAFGVVQALWRRIDAPDFDARRAVDGVARKARV